jgi:NADH dehydrogenase
MKMHGPAHSAPSLQQSRPQPVVIVLGAGFDGLTGAKQLAKAPVDITLIDREYHHRLQALPRPGLDVRLTQAVMRCAATGVTLGDENVRAGTVIWAAGVAASPATDWLAAASNCCGRVLVGADLRPPGMDDVLIIGDTALANDVVGKPLPGIASVAKHQGDYVAQAIQVRLTGKAEPPPLRYRDRGLLATVGRKTAVIAFARLRLKGRLAWWVWGIAHISFLISQRNPLIVMTQWLWSYVSFERGARLITGLRAIPEPDRLGRRDDVDAPPSPFAPSYPHS